jgi:hypothetical protein
MSFIFDVSYVANPTSEADFVHLSTAALPPQLPACVWRRLLPGDTGSSADSSDGCGSWAHHRQPWVVVDKSCARLAASPDTDLGYGVFAWRQFREGDALGIYCGRVLGKPSAVNPYLGQLPQAGEFDATIVISKHVISGKHSPYGDVGSNLPTVIAAGSSGGRVLYDRQFVSWPGMFAHLVNDAHGVTGASYNVQVTEPDGVMQAICDMDSIYFPSAKAGANAAAELFWSYGRNFRKGLRETGREQQPQLQRQPKRTRKQEQLQLQQPHTHCYVAASYTLLHLTHCCIHILHTAASYTLLHPHLTHCCIHILHTATSPHQEHELSHCCKTSASAC